MRLGLHRLDKSAAPSGLFYWFLTLALATITDVKIFKVSFPSFHISGCAWSHVHFFASASDWPATAIRPSALFLCFMRASESAEHIWSRYDFRRVWEDICALSPLRSLFPSVVVSFSKCGYSGVRDLPDFLPTSNEPLVQFFGVGHQPAIQTLQIEKNSCRYDNAIHALHSTCSEWTMKRKSMKDWVSDSMKKVQRVATRSSSFSLIYFFT